METACTGMGWVALARSTAFQNSASEIGVRSMSDVTWIVLQADGRAADDGHRQRALQFPVECPEELLEVSGRELAQRGHVSSRSRGTSPLSCS